MNLSEGPRETNYFLETRSVAVPLHSEFKPPPILLSRKGPKTPKPPTDSVSNLHIRDESSSEEDENSKKTLTLVERQAQAAKEREEKQRKYDERRLELFGAHTTSGAANNNAAASNNNSGNSTPRNNTPTPPHSRSATPNRSRGRGGRRAGAAAVVTRDQQQQQQQQQRPSTNLYDASYSPKPDSLYVQRQEGTSVLKTDEVAPVRAPKGPDGTGRGGFGFAPRGTKAAT